MQKEKPRIARLTAIITQLQSQRLLTAREIAEKHQVSIRTVYRDIRTLEQSGIPVFTEEGKGYSLIDGYKLPPVMFTEEEANALITAGKIINQNSDKSLVDHYGKAVEKIKAILKYSQKDKSELLSERLQIRNYEDRKVTSDYLMPFQTAITNYQVVSINYLSLEEKETKRDIEPFALIQTQGNWILIAFCRLRKEFRAFRLDRIKQMNLTWEDFEPHDITLQDFYDKIRKEMPK